MFFETLDKNKEKTHLNLKSTQRKSKTFAWDKTGNPAKAAISVFFLFLFIPWYLYTWRRVSQLWQCTLVSLSLFCLIQVFCDRNYSLAEGPWGHHLELAGFLDCPINYGCFVNMGSQIILRWLQLASAFLPSTPATHSGSQLHPLSCLPSLK